MNPIMYPPELAERERIRTIELLLDAEWNPRGRYFVKSHKTIERGILPSTLFWDEDGTPIHAAGQVGALIVKWMSRNLTDKPGENNGPR